MRFIDFIEKLQNKPRHVRVKIMWTGVVISMFFVFCFWIWSLDLLIKKPMETAQKEEGQFSKSWSQIKEDVPSLWESLGAGIGNILKDAQEAENQNTDQTLTPQAQEEESESPQEPSSTPTVGLPVE